MDYLRRSRAGSAARPPAEEEEEEEEEKGWASFFPDQCNPNAFQSWGKESGVSLIEMKTISDFLLKHTETFHST